MFEQQNAGRRGRRERTRVLAIKISPVEQTWLRDYAERQGETVSDIVREAIRSLADSPKDRKLVQLGRQVGIG